MDMEREMWEVGDGIYLAYLPDGRWEIGKNHGISQAGDGRWKKSFKKRYIYSHLTQLDLVIKHQHNLPSYRGGVIRRPEAYLFGRREVGGKTRI